MTEKPIYGKRKTPNRLPLSPRGQDLVRSLIDSKRIVNRMQQFILGELDAHGQPIVMTRDQVSAATALLRKCVPDQAAVVHSGDPTNPIATSLTISFKRPETEPPTITVEANRLIGLEDPETGANHVRAQLKTP